MIPTSSQRDGSSYSGVPLTTNPSNPSSISYPLTQVEVKNCAFYSIKGYKYPSTYQEKAVLSAAADAAACLIG